MNTPSVLDRVRSALLPARGGGVVVAVSGGGDSVGLLRLIGAVSEGLELRVSVAHLDHGTRGEEGRGDAAFVAELAGSLGLPFDAGRWSPTRANHFEADARKARYAWLVEVATNRDAAFVAAGHTRDDQAETILHRIVRGTGLKGLAGMPGRRALAEGVTLIRPLLGVSRAEVRAHLAALGQPFREDATNGDLRRTRNRIRHDLLPKLAAEYNPNVIDALARLGGFAADLRAWDRFIELQVEAARVEIGDLAVVLMRGPLLVVPLASRAEVIRRVWRLAGWGEKGMTAKRWLGLSAAVAIGPARYSIGGGIDVWMSTDILRLSPAREGQEPRRDPIPLHVPGRAIWGERFVDARPDSRATDGEVIDLDQLDPIRTTEGRPVLWIRPPKDGDRFDPLGLGGHTQALNDFFRGRDVPLDRRKDVPILYDRRGIVWVVEHRIAHRVRVTEGTKSRLFLRSDSASGLGCG